MPMVHPPSSHPTSYFPEEVDSFLVAHLILPTVFLVWCILEQEEEVVRKTCTHLAMQTCDGWTILETEPYCKLGMFAFAEDIPIFEICCIQYQIKFPRCDVIYEQYGYKLDLTVKIDGDISLLEEGA